MPASGEGQGSRALSPMAAALLVDLVDAITFGPLGVRAGLVAGAIAGFALAPQLGFAGRRWLPALLAAVYCTVPGTAWIPLAALLNGLRLLSGEGSAPEASHEPTGAAAERPAPGAIEADYRSRWDDEGDG